MPTQKPSRWKKEAALQFSDPTMAADYAARDRYAPEAFQLLSTLMTNGRVLDVGCGTGDVAIPLASFAGLIDAADISAAMIEEGKNRPGGDSPVIRWQVGKMEDLATSGALQGNYGLVTAGDCIHWFDWPVFFPALKRLMAPGACLAMLTRIKVPGTWANDEKELLRQYDTGSPLGSFKTVVALEEQGYFRLEQEVDTLPIPVKKSVDAYIQEVFSRNGFSRSLLGEHRERELTQQLTAILQPHVIEDCVVYHSYTRVRYGDVL